MQFSEAYVDVVMQMAADKELMLRWLVQQLEDCLRNKEITREHFDKIYRYILTR